MRVNTLDRTNARCVMPIEEALQPCRLNSFSEGVVVDTADQVRANKHAIGGLLAWMVEHGGMPLDDAAEMAGMGRGIMFPVRTAEDTCPKFRLVKDEHTGGYTFSGLIPLDALALTTFTQEGRAHVSRLRGCSTASVCLESIAAIFAAQEALDEEES